MFININIILLHAITTKNFKKDLICKETIYLIILDIVKFGIIRYKKMLSH
jgi:hypothetical protein